MCITGQVAPAPGCQNPIPPLVESPNEKRVRYSDTRIANTHVKTNNHTHTHTNTHAHTHTHTHTKTHTHTHHLIQQGRTSSQMLLNGRELPHRPPAPAQLSQRQVR